MTLGEKIQELRRRNGMSQDTLAELLDVSRQAVSKWERDEAVPETDKIIRIAKTFSVSTDYLLLEEQPQPQPAAPPMPRHPSTGARIERFVRRHGYKAGYVMMAAGALVCVIGLLVLCLMPGFGSGMFDAFEDTNDSMKDVYLDNSFGVVPGFDGMQDVFDQQVDQMETMWSSGTTVIALIFAIPTLLIGIALITFGIVIVAKGKKIARETP